MEQEQEEVVQVLFSLIQVSGVEFLHPVRFLKVRVQLESIKIQKDDSFF
jgi:hypothetical protein